MPVASAADQFDVQIKALQNEIEAKRARAAELAAQADTLENRIATLNTQISEIQVQINLNQQAKQKQLEAQIDEAKRNMNFKRQRCLRH